MIKKRKNELNDIPNKHLMYRDAREILIKKWAKFVHQAVLDLKSTAQTKSDLDRAVDKHFFVVVANQALWAVTEISSHQSWKYGAQPYKTPEAHDQITKGGAKCYQALRHEHVIERKDLVGRLESKKTVAEVEEVLRQAYSCIVTTVQDETLRRNAKTSGVSGKKRYANLMIHTSESPKPALDVFRDLE